MRIGGVHQVGLHAEDLDRAEAFFRDSEGNLVGLVESRLPS